MATVSAASVDRDTLFIFLVNESKWCAAHVTGPFRSVGRPKLMMTDCILLESRNVA